MQQKPGRNDPCWCGSGKKYKLCHMRQDEPVRAPRAAKDNLFQHLDQFATRTQFKAEFEEAFEIFFGDEPMLPEDEEERIIEFRRVLDYFIYDYPLTNGQRVIERFLETQGRRLSPEERALATDWLNSRPGVYEIVGVQPGQGLSLRDLVSGDEFQVREVRGSQQLKRWDLLVARLLRVQDHFELSAGVLHLPGRARSQVRSFLHQEWFDYQMEFTHAAYNDFLHVAVPLVNRFVTDEVIPSLYQMPTLVTMEGDLFEECVATFDVIDYDQALASLRSAVEFVLTDEEGPVEEQGFSWHEVGASLALLQAHGPAFEHKPAVKAGQGGERSLGGGTLAPGKLTLETHSRRRLEAGKALLQQYLGNAIRHRQDEIKEFKVDLSELKQEPAEVEEEAERPEALRALEAEIMARDRREWLDREIPALFGQTPRQAVQTLGGRVRVMRLLKQFERMEESKRRSGKIAFDIDAMKTELGLTDQEFRDETFLEDHVKEELETIQELTWEDRVNEALDAWRTFRQTHPLRSVDDLDFGEIWDLLEISDEAVRELAHRLAMWKRYDEGMALLAEYIDLDPDDPDQYRADMAVMRIERGEVDQGLRELEELAAHNLDDYLIQHSLATVQRDFLNRPEAALATLRAAYQVIEDDFDRGQVYEEILHTLLDAGHPSEAEQFWHDENDSFEEDERDYIGLAKVLIARGDLAQAREAVAKESREIARLYWTGMVESLAGNQAEARQAWGDRLEEPERDDWFLWAEWTALHLRLGEADRVVEKIDPVRMQANAYAYFYVAIAHAMLGHLAQAADWARQAREAMERKSRRKHFTATLEFMRRLADDLRLPDAARNALGV